MGRIYRRGRTWHAYWTDQAGQAQRRSLRTQDRDVARARLRELELAATNPAAYSGQTLGVALDALFAAMAASGRPASTIGAYQQKARHLERLLGADCRIATLTRDDVSGYAQTRLAEKAHPHTVAKEIVVLRRALHEAGERKKWDGDVRVIAPTIKTKYRPRARWLTREEADRLLTVLSPERRRWVMLAVYAGLRASEVELLRWEHVDWSAGVLRVHGTKTDGSYRSIPIAPQLAAELKMGPSEGLVVEPWINVRRDLSVAMTEAIEGAPRRRLPKGDQHPPRPLESRISPNDLRRTFASWLVQAGVPMLTVAHLLGHSSTRMVEKVYGRLSPDTYRDAIATAFGGCAAGVQPKRRKTGRSGDTGEATPTEIRSRYAQVAVPRDGVEPPTRGFSGPVLVPLKRRSA